MDERRAGHRRRRGRRHRGARAGARRPRRAGASRAAIASAAASARCATSARLPVEGGAEFIHGVDAADLARRARRGARRAARRRSAAAPCFDLGEGARWLPLALLHPGTWPTLQHPARHPAAARRPTVSARQFIERRGYRGRARVLAEMTLSAHLPGSVDEIGMLGLLEDRVAQARDRPQPPRRRRLRSAAAPSSPRDLDVETRLRRAAHRLAPRRACACEPPTAASARRAPPSAPCRSASSRSGARASSFPPLPEAQAAPRSAHSGMGPVLKILLRFEERFWPRWLDTLVLRRRTRDRSLAVFHGIADAPPVLIAYCTGPRAARARGVRARRRPRRSPSRDLGASLPRPPAARGSPAYRPHRLGRAIRSRAAAIPSCARAAAGRARASRRPTPGRCSGPARRRRRRPSPPRCRAPSQRPAGRCAGARASVGRMTTTGAHRRTCQRRSPTRSVRMRRSRKAQVPAARAKRSW